MPILGAERTGTTSHQGLNGNKEKGKGEEGGMCGPR